MNSYTQVFFKCAQHLLTSNFGSQAHGDAIKRGLVSYLYGESAMITMYAKCGRLDYAYQVFKSMDGPDTVAWTAMIAGCAYHGKALEALSLFREMQASGVTMNAVTFVAVFAACSHAGLVEEANRYLESMSREHGVEPTLDHYNCMINIYSRAGLLNEALDLINSMPFEPDAMSWKSLLGGCSIHRKYELGKTAAEKLLQLDPKDTAAYILLFNLRGLSGRWDEAASIRKLMAERDLRKAIGCSWITVKSKVHRFIVGDLHHPQTEEIYSKLKELKFSDTHKENALLTEDDVTDTLPARKNSFLSTVRGWLLHLASFQHQVMLLLWFSRISELAKIAMILRNMCLLLLDEQLLLEILIDSITSSPEMFLWGLLVTDYLK
ncbi:UNVERIFIED_CONTAM: Pentatricopeptide repeat-containing protein, chloroplastic [Sesamum radiatum]|uniref:Pentatricopeptide repeat-containing protein, chloroplastic n=1 Tax=Sesamum radiatum TaxID=300843 RepID=A0AAW2MZ46_SESRA